jgi:hypothetical protein
MHDILIPCVASGNLFVHAYLRQAPKQPVNSPKRPKIDYMHTILALGYAQ